MTGGINVTDFEAAAQRAKLTGQVRSFLDWLGEGRKLTQSGRIGMADARYLVEFLGTGDVIDPEIGGTVFKTRSSEELRYLTMIVEWAKAARLIRVTGIRLTPVKKNAALAGDPLDLVPAMLAAYPKLGKTLFPRGNMIAARYTVGRLTEQQYDFLRRTIVVDIRIAMSALHILGIVTLDTATDHEEADDSAELTALGRYAIRKLRG